MQTFLLKSWIKSIPCQLKRTRYLKRTLQLGLLSIWFGYIALRKQWNLVSSFFSWQRKSLSRQWFLQLSTHYSLGNWHHITSNCWEGYIKFWTISLVFTLARSCSLPPLQINSMPFKTRACPTWNKVTRLFKDVSQGPHVKMNWITLIMVSAILLKLAFWLSTIHTFFRSNYCHSKPSPPSSDSQQRTSCTHSFLRLSRKHGSFWRIHWGPWLSCVQQFQTENPEWRTLLCPELE